MTFIEQVGRAGFAAAIEHFAALAKPRANDAHSRMERRGNLRLLPVPAVKEAT